MSTRALVIAFSLIVLLLMFVVTGCARGDEPCGRDGCPVKVQLVPTGPLHKPGYAPMPVGAGPTVVCAHPLVAEVRLEHPLRTFICECHERAHDRREARRARR